ncbi:hypothetical protein L0U88_11155 [Flavihumibacter sp. RY-1]|uniref:Uncharacterized protein n=1 Tax=Flavihumibacter fluminis TaxID=2909236 RepID=A0ABS9BHK0_9BACT|nr:hypothetical protein [Flavihumibacter fluminis]MCF1715183.1 hypothetical protein [Flavihumibacter fluminis]
MNDPKKLFLIDGMGAIGTASLLLLLPVLFPGIFGLPDPYTKLLGGIAICFAIYSLYNYVWFNPAKWKPLLKVISIANAVYCVISLGILLLHYQQITTIGWLYFMGEIAIIMLLVSWEMKVSSPS